MSNPVFANSAKSFKLAVIIAVGTAGFLGSMGKAQAEMSDSDWRKTALVGLGISAGIVSTFNPIAGMSSTVGMSLAYGTLQYLAKEDLAKVDVIDAQKDALAFLNGSGVVTPALQKAFNILRSQGYNGDEHMMATHVISKGQHYKRDIDSNCKLFPAIVCKNGTGGKTATPVEITKASATVDSAAPDVVPGYVAPAGDYNSGAGGSTAFSGR